MSDVSELTCWKRRDISVDMTFLCLKKYGVFPPKDTSVLNSCCDPIIFLRNSNTMSELSGFAHLSLGKHRGKGHRGDMKLQPPPLLESRCTPHPVNTAAGNAEESTISHRQPAVVTLTVLRCSKKKTKKKKPTWNTRDMSGCKKENVAFL